MNRIGATTIFQTRMAAMIIPTIFSRFLFESDIPFNTATDPKGFREVGSPWDLDAQREFPCANLFTPNEAV
jgi:hypothetical protein